MVSLCHAVNIGFDAAHVFLEGLEVAPQSPAVRVGIINPAGPGNVPAAPASSVVYQAVKTNLVFLDIVFTIFKWSEAVSKRSEFKFVTSSLLLIRGFHFIHGIYRLSQENGLDDEEKKKSIYDLGSNAVDILIYMINLNMLGKLSPFLKIPSLLIDVIVRSVSVFHIERFGDIASVDQMIAIVRNIRNEHPNHWGDFLRMFLYVIHFIVTSSCAITLYHAGRMLASRSLAVNEKSVSEAFLIFCLFFSIGQGLSHILKDKYPKEQLDLGRQVGSGVLFILSSLVIYRSFPNFVQTIIKDFVPQSKIAGIVFLVCVITKFVFMNLMSHIRSETDRIEEWTSSIVVSVLATSLITTRWKIVEHSSRFWSSISQITLFACSVFLLQRAWSVVINRLVLSVPPGNNLEDHDVYKGLKTFLAL